MLASRIPCRIISAHKPVMPASHWTAKSTCTRQPKYSCGLSHNAACAGLPLEITRGVNHSASLKVSSNLGSKARWRKGDRELEADLQTLIARVMPAGYASSRGKGCFIADHTSLQHVCRSRCKLPLAGHCLISIVPSARAMQVSTCTMRQMSVVNGCWKAFSSR